MASDNRLKPGESRLETFLFSKGVTDIGSIRASAVVYYPATVPSEAAIKVPLSDAERIIE